MFAEKARAITKLVQRLCQQKNDLENNRARVVETVSLINALTIPRCWVGLDEDGRLHVTYYAKTRTEPAGLAGLKPGELMTLSGSSTPRGPMALTATADYVWEYDQREGTVRCTKSRCGRWVDQTVKCEPGALPVID